MTIDMKLEYTQNELIFRVINNSSILLEIVYN